MAPGLVASRQAEGPAASSCRPPESDQWFTALGAAARHTSVIELVNPDPGPAVADITVIGPRGPVDAPSLRGITVPGGRSIRLDLAQEIPLRGELAAHVEVSRGRLGVHATDSFDELGRGDAGVDWLPAQQPGEDLLLLGLPAGTGTRSLVLANAGDDEARAVVRVVTEDSAFRPEGLEDVRVPPGSVTRVPLSAILGTAVQDGAVGVQVEATHPLTATLRSFVDGDVSHAVPLPTVTETTQVILPTGRATVLLSSASVGSAEVLARLPGGGKKVQQVDLAPGRTVSVELPEDAVLVQVTPTATPVRGAVVVVDGGAAVLGLTSWCGPGWCPTCGPPCRSPHRWLRKDEVLSRNHGTGQGPSPRYRTSRSSATSSTLARSEDHSADARKVVAVVYPTDRPSLPARSFRHARDAEPHLVVPFGLAERHPRLARQPRRVVRLVHLCLVRDLLRRRVLPGARRDRTAAVDRRGLRDRLPDAARSVAGCSACTPTGAGAAPRSPCRSP